MKKVPIEELMKQTFPNGVFVDSEGLDIRYRFDGEDYLVFINETDSLEAAAVIAHCLNTHQMLLDALKPFAQEGFVKKLGGNCHGDDSIIFQRERSQITLGDCRRAAKAIQSASFVEVQE